MENLYVIIVFIISSLVSVAPVPFHDGRYHAQYHQKVNDGGMYTRPPNEGKYVPGDEGKYTYIYKQFIDNIPKYMHIMGPGDGSYYDKISRLLNSDESNFIKNIAPFCNCEQNKFTRNHFYSGPTYLPPPLQVKSNYTIEETVVISEPVTENIVEKHETDTGTTTEMFDDKVNGGNMVFIYELNEGAGPKLYQSIVAPTSTDSAPLEIPSSTETGTEEEVLTTTQESKLSNIIAKTLSKERVVLPTTTVASTPIRSTVTTTESMTAATTNGEDETTTFDMKQDISGSIGLNLDLDLPFYDEDIVALRKNTVSVTEKVPLSDEETTMYSSSTATKPREARELKESDVPVELKELNLRNDDFKIVKIMVFVEANID